MPKLNTYGDSDEEEDILSVSSDNDNLSDTEDTTIQRKNPSLSLFNNDDDDIDIVDDDEDDENENDDIDIGDDDNFTGGGNGDDSADEDDGGDYLNKNAAGIDLTENYDDDADDDEDDDDDENYHQKFNEDVNKKYISDYHPECLIHNYDEIALLTTVVRDTNNIIIDDLHKTIPFLTKYEKARILGQRAKQIDSGASPFVKVPDNIIDGYIIAEIELQEKKIPFIIRRPIPGGGSEYWNLKDLEIIN
jgi:DNA-directed RNA polymerase I, II, and III subunit RPABC2